LPARPLSLLGAARAPADKFALPMPMSAPKADQIDGDHSKQQKNTKTRTRDNDPSYRRSSKPSPDFHCDTHDTMADARELTDGQV